MTTPFRLLLLPVVSLALFLIIRPTASQAQQPTVELYKARLITVDGRRIQGILENTDSSEVYLSGRRGDYVPLAMIRKMVVRQVSKKRVQRLGAFLGGVGGGYLAVEGLGRNPTRSGVLYGFTVSFSAVAGASAGLLAASAIGNVNSRVIRPAGGDNPTTGLYRELKPFTRQYQQELINHLINSRPQ